MCNQISTKLFSFVRKFFPEVPQFFKDMGLAIDVIIRQMSDMEQGFPVSSVNKIQDMPTEEKWAILKMSCSPVRETGQKIPCSISSTTKQHYRIWYYIKQRHILKKF